MDRFNQARTKPRDRRRQVPGGAVVPTLSSNDPGDRYSATEKRRPFLTTRRVAAALVLVIALAVFALYTWSTGTYQARRLADMSSVEIVSAEIDSAKGTTETLESVTHLEAAAELKTSLLGLNARVESLIDSVTVLQHELDEVGGEFQRLEIASTESQPVDREKASEISQEDFAQFAQEDLAQEDLAVTLVVPPDPAVDDTAGAPLPSLPQPGGAWEINLASCHSKRVADRLTETANSLGIPASQEHTTVNGREFWRLRVKGFRTVEEARSYANSVKTKLDLDEVWLVKRKQLSQ